MKKKHSYYLFRDIQSKAPLFHLRHRGF